MPKNTKDYQFLLDNLRAQRQPKTSGQQVPNPGEANSYIGPGSLMKMVARPPEEKVFYPEGEGEFELTPREQEMDAYEARERRDMLPDHPMELTLLDRMREAYAKRERRDMLPDHPGLSGLPEGSRVQRLPSRIEDAGMTEDEMSQLEYLLTKAGRQ